MVNSLGLNPAHNPFNTIAREEPIDLSFLAQATHKMVCFHGYERLRKETNITQLCTLNSLANKSRIV